MVHQGGDRRGGRGEELDLFGMERKFLTGETAEGLHVRLRAAGMGGDQIAGQELFLSRLRRELAEEIAEGEQGPGSRFPHAPENLLLRVFGGHLHLSGDVAADDLAEVGDAVFPVGEEEIVPDAGGDDRLFDAGNLPEFPEEGDLAAVIGTEVFAHLGVEAASVEAGTAGELLWAFEPVHVGRRPAHVEDASLEAGEGCQQFRLPEDGGLAPGADRPPLVDGDGAEMTTPVAPPVGGDGKADRLQSPNLAAAVMAGMSRPLEIHPVDLVHLRLR